MLFKKKCEAKIHEEERYDLKVFKGSNFSSAIYFENKLQQVKESTLELVRQKCRILGHSDSD